MCLLRGQEGSATGTPQALELVKVNSHWAELGAWMPHDSEGGFEARGRRLVHVSLPLGQKVIADVDIVLGRYAAACRVEHTLMPSTWSSARYRCAAGRGTCIRPAEFLKEPIMFGYEVGEEEICRRKGRGGYLEWFPGACQSYAAKHLRVSRIENWSTMKPKAPTRLGKILGKRKQDEMSKNAKE